MDRIEKTIILITILGLSLICVLALFLVGCQTPGNVLTIDDVERILESDGEIICLDDGFDRICTKLIPGPPGKDGKNATTIRITEKSTIYQFNYQGKPILVAERQVIDNEVSNPDTADSVGGNSHSRPLDEEPSKTDNSDEPVGEVSNPDTADSVGGNSHSRPLDEETSKTDSSEEPVGGVSNPDTADSVGGNSHSRPLDEEPSKTDTETKQPQPDILETHHAPSGWIVWIYYIDVPPDSERGLTPETCGFDFEVRDADNNVIVIEHVVQVDGPDGSAVQFFVETDSEAIVIDVEGLIDAHRATFIMDSDGVISHEGTDTFQLQPL